MAAWAGLRLDLVGRILARLPCLAHRAAFSAVCFNWLAVAAQHPPPPPPQLPWLLLPSAEAEAPAFFCILCGNTHRAFLPDNVRAARCCGSHPRGWLVLALQLLGGDYALHNLNTGERLDVPDILHTADCIGETGMVVSGAALSSAPNMDGSFLAVVLAQCASSIAFWCPGMVYLSPPTPAEPHERASWRRMLPHGEIADVIYFAGHGLEGFHVLTDAEEVLVYVPEFALDGALTTRLVTYRFPGHKVTWIPEPRHTISRYLLDFFGDLVMVVRYVSMQEDEGRSTRWIHAFRLRLAAQAGNHGDREAYWDRIRFPVAGAVVVLGRCSSVAVFSPAVALDGLYFLDDAKSFDDVTAALQAGQPFPCTDMGRCTTQHQQPQAEHVFPIRPPSVFSPAVWFFHSDPDL